MTSKGFSLRPCCRAAGILICELLRVYLIALMLSTALAAHSGRNDRIVPPCAGLQPSIFATFAIGTPALSIRETAVFVESAREPLDLLDLGDTFICLTSSFPGENFGRA